jgi:hypothetical protein
MLIPNGHIVLALNLADPLDITTFSEGGPVKQRFGSVLFGHHARGLRAEMSGDLELMCIYLNTEFVHHYCKTTVSAFADTPLLRPHEVFGQKMEVLEQGAQTGKTLTEKVSLVEEAFRKCFRLDFYPDAAFLAAKQLILNTGGQLPVDKVSHAGSTGC